MLLLLLLLGEVGSLTGGGEPECEKLVEEAYQWAVGQGRPVDAAKARELFLQAAEQGDPRALAWKGQRLYRGEPPFAKDQETGLRIFREIEKPLKKMADENRPYAAKILAGSWAVLDREKKGKEAFQLMKSLAETGDPDAIGYLGWFTEEGIGVQADPQAAFSFYKKAAEGGDILSFWHVGSAYQNGRGISRDLAQAFRWYSRGAEKNEPSCQRMVAIAYFQGEGVTKDEAAAFGWFVKSAQLGNAESQDWLGWLYEAGRGTPADPKQAFVWFQKSAEAGYASGQKNLARCYEDGIGVSPDPEKAFRYYQKAAEGGQSWAMGKVAKFLETGKGTVKNPAEAFRWWQRQAEAGDFWAPEQLARCHAEGIGTPKNAEEAGKWYGQLRAKLEEETKKGSVWAWDNLGRYFFKGLGVDRDYAKALECYHKAAALKSGWAMEQIGWCHEKGLGVPVDEKEALKWYRKAAESGQTWSMGHVAVLYETGRGTEKNPAEAYRWYRKRRRQEPAIAGRMKTWVDVMKKRLAPKRTMRKPCAGTRRPPGKGACGPGSKRGDFMRKDSGPRKIRRWPIVFTCHRFRTKGPGLNIASSPWARVITTKVNMNLRSVVSKRRGNLDIVRRHIGFTNCTPGIQPGKKPILSREFKSNESLYGNSRMKPRDPEFWLGRP